MQEHKQIEQQHSENLSQKTKWQKFEYREIKRSQIQGAPYNPRKITDYAKQLLKNKIKEVGCVEPLVWNEKTGNLISGHQRLSIIDDLEGTQDYKLAVAIVCLTEKKEKELNVFLNNTTAQGFYDKDAFFELLKDPGISLDGIGFTKMDIELEFGELPEIEGISPIKKHEKSVEEIAENIKKLKEAKKVYKERCEKEPENDADYYLMVAFRSMQDKDDFLKKIGEQPGLNFLTADELVMYLKPEIQWRKKENVQQREKEEKR